MGYQYETLNVEHVNDADIEQLIVGLDQRRRRSFARRFLRVVVTLAVALALVNAYVVPLNFFPYPTTRIVATDSSIQLKAMDDFEIGDVIQCWTAEDTTPIEDNHSDPERHHAKFPEIALDSDAVYFFARSFDHGGHDHSQRATAGGISFEVSDDVDVVTLSAEVAYYHRIYSQVCAYKRDDGSLGVGVIVPEHDHDHDHDHEPDHPDHGHRHRFRPNTYRLVVTFPTSSDGPTKIKSLQTSFPLYAHAIRDIGSSVTFGSVVLRGANSPIASQSLTAGTADVGTSNAPITGSFNGTDALKLRTANAPIEVDVDFTTTRKNGEPAVLDILTANANVRAAIALGATDEAGPGAFDVHVRTANAPLDVTFTSAPAESLLNFQGSTQNAPATLVLDPTYQGTFEARTQWFKANLEIRDVDDPSGKGRKRSAAVTEVNRGVARGYVYWGEKREDGPQGTAVISTTLSPVSLTV